MIAHFLFADKLQFRIFQIEFVHYVNGVGKIAADAVTDYTQFHCSSFSILAVQFGARDFFHHPGTNPVVSFGVSCLALMEDLHRG